MIIRNLDVICIITCEIPYVGKEENERNILFFACMLCPAKPFKTTAAAVCIKVQLIIT